MAALIPLIKAIPKLVDLVQRFVEAWLAHQIKEIQEDNSKKIAARSALLRKIEQARLERNRDELIALNHALSIFERSGL
jgi:ribosome-binding protein aMBF1 (putative translation factor)